LTLDEADEIAKNNDVLVKIVLRLSEIERSNVEGNADTVGAERLRQVYLIICPHGSRASSFVNYELQSCPRFI
jgi:hypothetical protein